MVVSDQNLTLEATLGCEEGRNSQNSGEIEDSSVFNISNHSLLSSRVGLDGLLEENYFDQGRVYTMTRTWSQLITNG